MFYWNRLDTKQQSIIKRHLRRGVNFLAPTLCPADKNAESCELESFEWVINYYKKQGLDYTVLQPKFMGSRVQLYLYRDQPGIAFTRSGFPVQKPEIQPLLEYWKEKVFAKLPDAKFIILDGELLPWSFFAKELIKRDFDPIYYGNLEELLFFAESGFFDKYEKSLQLSKTHESEFLELIEAEKSGNYTKRQIKKFKTPLIEKYGHFKYKNFKTFLETEKLDALTHPTASKFLKLQKYLKQVKYYGANYELRFEPFQILKVDDRVLPYSNLDGFRFLSNRPCKLIDINSEKDCKDAKVLYQTWVNNPDWFGECAALEGVVVKPLNPKHYTPGFKVRNKEYLRLVYGPYYDLPNTYKTIFDKKYVKRKLQISIKEHQLGLKLLSFSKDQIQAEGMDLANSDLYEEMQVVPTIIDFFRSEHQLRSVDPRL